MSCLIIYMLVSIVVSFIFQQKQDFIHEISINLSYKITNNEKRYDMLIIETGATPLYDIEQSYTILCLNYLFN